MNLMSIAALTIIVNFRELGLVETFVVGQLTSLIAGKGDSLHTGNIQKFDYVIVIDFESTCWDAKDNQNKWQNLAEIIEFPAVLLNVKTGVIEDKFHHYVMPVENPMLSDFCVKLTGINQETVNAGIPLGTCLMLFNRWITKISVEKNISFHKPSNKSKTCTFVTWSVDWDLAMCLHNETKRKQIRKPDVLTQWIDLRLAYRKFYQRKPQGLKGALAEVGLPFTGREHSGIIDAENTAKLVTRMVKDGYMLSITSSSEIPSPQINSRRCPLVNLKNTSTPLSREPESSKTRALRSGLHANNITRNNKRRLCNTDRGVYNDETDQCKPEKSSGVDTPKNRCNLDTVDICTPKQRNGGDPLTTPLNARFIHGGLWNVNLNNFNMPSSYISPSPSPDELVIQQRGRRSVPATWSPDIDAKKDGQNRRDCTPVKGPCPNSPLKNAVVRRSTPRKRLMLCDPKEMLSSPDKTKTRTGTSPNAKKTRVERTGLRSYSGPLKDALKGLSQEQLIDVIKNLVDKHPALENEMKESLPAPDLKPLEEQLNYLKKNIFKSLPNSRLTSKTDSPAYNRAATHVTAFKKCVLEQGRTLLDSQHWDAVIEYVVLAWSYVRATPLWDNPPHNAARRQCFKSLASQCMTALKKGVWNADQAKSLKERLEGFVVDSEDIRSCLKQLESLC
ncbi:ERI1 exoribonuclease 2 [Frankliniella fusca]|uniref:ERI1 exoribonuclease 2 n=1 Tax=Frankliniella fusca TaxID=407009 RepID=A0AAE1H3J0_9NEOP|nr:ERI1 exoribonuclease 2 [Frankliniella fusca]